MDVSTIESRLLGEDRLLIGSPINYAGIGGVGQPATGSPFAAINFTEGIHRKIMKSFNLNNPDEWESAWKQELSTFYTELRQTHAGRRKGQNLEALE